MTSKLDIIRASINSLENMDEETFVNTNYFQIILDTGGDKFTEAISMIREPTLETIFEYGENGEIIGEQIVSKTPGNPSKKEALSYMKACLMMLLLNEWSKE